MVIEWLKVKVAPEIREQYIQKDEEIWTTLLTKYSGFLGKEVWITPHKPDEVVLLIRWANREVWKSVPVAELEATERKFSEQIDQNLYKIIEEGEYQLRKFPQTDS